MPSAKTKGKAKQTPVDRIARKWCAQIERYDRGSMRWRERAAKVEKIYLDEHRKDDNADRRFAIVWANIETMKPATYARKPQAVVSRRWERDAAGRKASEILERCINDTFDLGNIDEVMEGVRDDLLITARGTAWVRYEAELEDAEEPEDAADADGDDAEEEDGQPAPTRQRVAAECVVNEFVHWIDFGHVLVPRWAAVPAVWRAVYMTREKVKERAFENEAAVKALKYEIRAELRDRSAGGDNDAEEPQCKIYEIWDKDSRQVIWLNKDSELCLEAGDPPLKFRNFFPCPMPVYGTKSTRSLIPQPDYRYYQDQAEEIDDLTAKISSLTSWLRLKGFIAQGPSSEGGDAAAKLLRLEQEVTSKGDAILVPVESWAGFAEKGGSKGLIEWLPLDVVVTALREAYNARREAKNDVFELTGVSDILRGETDPNETLGAQQLKAQTGSRRISTRQRALARFARDLAELNGEVIAELFQPKTMQEMSGLDMTVEAPPDLLLQHAMLKRQLEAPMMGQNGGPPLEGAPVQPGMPPAPAPAPQPDPKLVEQLQAIEKQLQDIELNKQVLAILRDERTRGFRIDIETDSTVEPDEQAEKQRAVEFLEAIGSFMERALPVVQQAPALLPFIKESLLFLARRFRAGRTLEDVLERSLDELEKASAQPHEAKPDPKMAKVESDAQLGKEKLANERRAQDLDATLEKRGQDVDASLAVHAGRQEAATAALDRFNNEPPVPGVG